MTPDSGILTNIESQFLNVFQAGFGNITPDALTLLGTLAVIELVLATLFWVLKGEDVLVGLIRKVMVIGLFIFFVQQWPTLVNTVIQGFVYAGTKAGGGQNVPSLGNPSAIIDYAFNIIIPINTEIQTIQKASWIGINATIFDLLVCKFLIILTCCIIAIQAFICYLEFYIIAVLALILVPFGVLKHTAFLAEKAIGSVISFGVKLMVLAFILSACMPVIQQFQLPTDPTFEQAMCLGLATAAIAFLAWQAPSIAAGMLSGGPSLSAGSALGAAAAGGAGMIAGLSAIKAAGSIPGAIASGTNSTIKAAGAIKDGFQSGGMSGAAKAMVGAGKANSARMNDAYQSGSIKPFSAGGTSSLGANASKAAMNIKSAVNSAISSEAGAHGGMSVPIKHSEG